MVTSEQIKEILESSMEDQTVALQLLEWIKKMQGRSLRKNTIPEGFYINKRYGKTYIVHTETREDFLVSYDEIHVILPSVEQFRSWNGRWFEGLEQRNSSRKNALSDPARLQAIADKINKAEEARKALVENLKEVMDIVDSHKLIALAHPLEKVEYYRLY